MAITCKKTLKPNIDCVCRLATKKERVAMSGQETINGCTAAIEADAAKFAVIGGASTNGDAIAQLKRGVVARPPAPAAMTPKDVLQKIDAAKSASDFSNISDNELKLITDDEIAKMTDVERKILAKLPASPGEATRIHNALAAAKGGNSQGSEEGVAIELKAKVPTDLRFNADGFGSKYDAAGLVRPRALSFGGQSSDGDNSFNGIAPVVAVLDRKKLSNDLTLSYGGMFDYAHYTVSDSNTILRNENNFSLHQFTFSGVVRGEWTPHKFFSLYGEFAPSLRLSTGSGRIATGAPEGEKDENAFTADKVPSQLVGQGSLGIAVGPRDSIHVRANLGLEGALYSFTQQTVLVEGAASPTKVTNDGGILTGGLSLVIPLSLFTNKKSK